MGSQTFKHIFTSPSSVEREAKATRSGNARIHGMTEVTRASIAYVATQVSLPFSRSRCHFHIYHLCFILASLCAMRVAGIL